VKAAIALLTDHRVQNYVRRMVYGLNRQHGIGFLASLLPAHVSLKQPFSFESMERLEGYFDALAAGIAPIEIELDSVYHARRGEYGILGLNVKGTSALRELHDRVNRELGDLFEDVSAPHDGESYHFHLTVELGKVEGEDVYKCYYDQMSDKRVNLKFTAREIALFYYDDLKVGSYMTYKVLELGSDQR
jgi:2'-5' RNA ligase